MAAVVGALRADLSANIGGFASDLAKGGKVVDTFANKVGNVGKGLMVGGAALTAGVTVPFLAFANASETAFEEAQQGASQTEAALKSMGNGSGRSFDELTQAAQRFQDTLAVDGDDVLKSVTANLLTFGNVAGEQFDRAQLAAINLSRRMGGDLQSSTLMVGKALNDPIKGLGALRRVGIQFTESQQELIKSLVKTGDVAGAQKIMLGELERQFGGSAAAYAKSAAGIKEANALAFGDIQEMVGEVVTSIKGPLLSVIHDLLTGFLALSPGAQKFALAGVAVLAVIGPLTTAIGGIIAAFSTIGPVMAGVEALMAGPLVAGFIGLLPVIGPIILAVGALVAAFFLFKDQIMPVLNDLWKTASETLGPPLQEMFKAIMDVLGPLWDAFKAGLDIVIPLIGELGGMALKVFGEQVINNLKAMVIIVTQVFQNIGSILKFFGQLLTGDFVGAWDTAKKFVVDNLNTMLKVVNTIFPGITKAVENLYNGVKTWLQDKLGGIIKWVITKVGEVGQAFFKLYDDVVGHSYVPDMIDGVASEFGRLPGVMVNPALDATKKVGDSFAGLASRVGDGLADMLVDGNLSMQGLRDMANGIAGDLFVTPFKQSLSKGISGAFSSLFGQGSGGGILSSFLGGFRAQGGPVNANTPYVVGENGPEIMTPSMGGNVTPNGAGQVVNVTQNIYANDASGFQRSERQSHRRAKAAYG